MTMPLEIHSAFSMMTGCARPRQLVARAVEYGMSSLVLTDRDGLYGFLPFYMAAREAGLNAIAGVRLGSCMVLAKNRQGYADLCALISAAHLGKFDKTQWKDWPFSFGSENLFLISHDKMITEGLAKQGLNPLVALRYYGDSRSRYEAEKLALWAKEKKLNSVAAAPVYFLDPEDYAIHRVLCAIRENTTLSALSASVTASPGAWFRSPEELERLYKPWPESLYMLARIEEECSLDLALGTPLFPEFPLPEGESAFSLLWKMVFEGLNKKYRPLTPAVLDRAHHELAIIHDQGFAPYFLIVADLVHFAQDKGIPVTGRGSAANSLVAHALGITRVDPLRYNLYFERFLNRSRTDCPDIDLDLCWRGRDQVINYVYKSYGHEHAAMVCTVNTFRGRSTVRETARALGHPEHEIARFTRGLPHYGAENLSALIKSLPECRHLQPDKEPLKSILKISEKIAGLPRHISMHAGGMVVTPQPLTHYLPLERSAKGMVITQYDKDAVEQMGLVKMDLLGHRALSAIHDTIHDIREHRDSDFDIEKISYADSACARLLSVGDTVACFQIESPAMRGLLKKLDARDCNAIIQAIALVRPGASGSGMKQHFIDRRLGREELVCPHPLMEEALGDTHGVMIYQEDVLRVAHAVAGMSLEEADGLRRAMSKKRSPREMRKSRRTFLEGAEKKGLSEEQAAAVWEQMSNFASYAYCKAHAATYGELAYQCAYLKTHYPAEYFSAVLANGGGFYAAPVYITEAQRQGVTLLPPDINKSAFTYQREGDGVRIGLMQIAHLSERTARKVLEARTADGRVTDIHDLQRRIHLSQVEVELLCQAGALDSVLSRENQLPLPRPVQMWTLGQNASKEELLFAEAPAGYAPFPDHTQRMQTDQEWSSLGFPLRASFLRYHAANCWSRPLVASSFLADYEGKEVSVLGTIIATRRLSLRQGRGSMKFLSLEDGWGVFEAVLFSESYERLGHLTEPGAVCLCTGRVQRERENTTLLISHMEKTSLDSSAEINYTGAL
ncbi:MAG: DNA polymerase III subunit alpha [Candidatus Hydrogenedens sp.]|nr:DNA polymerase III subunit alpha [Candidatus Hydrogenedens sp.]